MHQSFGFAEETGIGSVVPIEYVRNGLASKILREERAEMDKQDKKQKQSKGFVAQSKSKKKGSGFSRGEFLRDLHKATRPYPPGQSDREG